MKRILIKNTIILTLVAIVNRMIGVIFRTYLTNLISNEFLGLYNIMFNYFTLFVSFIASGIIVAVTRMIGDDLAVNKIKYKSCIHNKNLFSLCIYISLSIGVVSAILLFVTSDYFIPLTIGDNRLIKFLKIMSLCIPLISISACLRGYFYACDKIIYISVKELLEQVLEIVIFFIIIFNIGSTNIESACFAIAWGSVLSEFLSLICSFLLFLYYRTNKCLVINNHISINRFIKEIFKIIVPIGSSSLVSSGFSTLKSIIIPKCLIMYGLSYSSSMSIYGLLSGIVLPMIYFPSVLLSSFSSLIISKISSKNMMHHNNGIKYIINRSIKFSFSFSFFILMVYFFFSSQISAIVGSDISFYLKLFSVIIPFIYLDIVTDSILKALNKQVFVFVNNTVLSMISIIIILKFVPAYGIKALIYNIFMINIINFCSVMYYLSNDNIKTLAKS